MIWQKNRGRRETGAFIDTVENIKKPKNLAIAFAAIVLLLFLGDEGVCARARNMKTKTQDTRDPASKSFRMLRPARPTADMYAFGYVAKIHVVATLGVCV